MTQERYSDIEKHSQGDEPSRSARSKFVPLYTILGTFLLIAAFLAGGIFMTSAHASSTPTQKNALDQSKSCKPQKPTDPNTSDISGTVTAINGTTLTVHPLKGASTFTVQTNGSTKFVNKLLGKTVSLRDIKVGDFIFVTGATRGSETLTATTVVVGPTPTTQDGKKDSEKKEDAQKPGSVTLLGHITAINGSTLTLTSLTDGKLYTIHTDSHTEMGSKIAGRQISISELKIGDFVVVSGSLASQSVLNATSLTVGTPPTDGPVCK